MFNGVTGNRLTIATVGKSGVSSIDTLFRNVKWALGADATITYSFPGANGASYSLGTNYPNPEARSILTPSDSFMANVAQALGTWSAVANVKFQQVADTAAGAGDIRFFITNEAPTTNSAFAMRPYEALGNAAAGDIVFYNQMQRSSAEGTFNYLTIVHEVGHALGLKHPGAYLNGGASDPPYLPSALDNSAYSIMSYNYEPKILSRLVGPSLYDIEAIQYLYGANLAYAPGDQTYTVSTSNFRTIWDPNGVNTMSGRNINASQILNAQESSFSSAGGYYTAAVARGTKISNLEGGTGNDTLLGNALDNRFIGGKGDDNITGGGGIDTAVYSGKRANYSVTKSGASYVVKDLTASGEGTDTLSGVSYLSFSDGAQTIEAASNTATALRSGNTVDIQKAYIAFFNRPADPVGMAFWQDQTRNLDTIAPVIVGFSSSAEYLSAYAGLTSVQRISKLYVNLFGRDAESGGLNFWVTRLNDGTLNIGNIAYTIANGAQNSDATVINNKVTVAAAFTASLDTSEKISAYSGLTAAQTARSLLSTVTSDAATVTTATAGIPAVVNNLLNGRAGMAATGSNAPGAGESGLADLLPDKSIPLTGLNFGDAYA